MITSAHRLNLVSEYYFANKLREIARMRESGIKVINLGIGSPDVAPHQKVVEALLAGAQNPSSHGYQSYIGHSSLREAWATWYQKYYGVTLQPENQVLPLIGSKEGISHIAFAFLEPGDIALVPNPGYPAYRAASLLAGAEVVQYDLTPSNGWEPDFNALAALDLSRVKVMWVNYPHMPTGAPGSEGLFQRLVDFGKAHKILIVNDNPYSFILNSRPRSILSAAGAMEVALELNSLSKSHNMAGWRMGMVGGQARYLQDILRFKSNMDSGQFLPAQQAAVAALGLPASWYEQQNQTYRERQHAAFNLLENIECQYDRQQQGLFLWAKIPPGYADGFAFSDALLRYCNLFVTPGGVFGDAGNAYIRVSLCSPVEEWETAVERVSNCPLFHTQELV